MSDMVLFGKDEGPELTELNFRGQLQCKMDGAGDKMGDRGISEVLEIEPLAKEGKSDPEGLQGFRPARSCSS